MLWHKQPSSKSTQSFFNCIAIQPLHIGHYDDYSQKVCLYIGNKNKTSFDMTVPAKGCNLFIWHKIAFFPKTNICLTELACEKASGCYCFGSESYAVIILMRDKILETKKRKQEKYYSNNAASAFFSNCINFHAGKVTLA